MLIQLSALQTRVHLKRQCEKKYYDFPSLPMRKLRHKKVKQHIEVEVIGGAACRVDPFSLQKTLPPAPVPLGHHRIACVVGETPSGMMSQCDVSDTGFGVRWGVLL